MIHSQGSAQTPIGRGATRHVGVYFPFLAEASPSPVSSLISSSCSQTYLGAIVVIVGPLITAVGVVKEV